MAAKSSCCPLPASAAVVSGSVSTFSGQHLLHPQNSSKGESHGCGGKSQPFQTGSLQSDHLPQAQGHRCGRKSLPFQTGSLQSDHLPQAQGNKPLRQEPLLASCHLFRIKEVKGGERKGNELIQSPRGSENRETPSHPSPVTSVGFILFFILSSHLKFHSSCVVTKTEASFLPRCVCFQTPNRCKQNRSSTVYTVFLICILVTKITSN